MKIRFFQLVHWMTLKPSMVCIRIISIRFATDWHMVHISAMQATQNLSQIPTFAINSSTIRLNRKLLTVLFLSHSFLFLMTLEQQRIYDEVETMRNRLFDLANSQAGNDKGNVAALLHAASSEISRAQKCLIRGNPANEPIPRHLLMLSLGLVD